MFLDKKNPSGIKNFQNAMLRRLMAFVSRNVPMQSPLEFGDGASRGNKCIIKRHQGEVSSF